MEKGKLKIFFGYAAGVGKTYAMLNAAKNLIKNGVDVVIGYVEPHARPDTIKLTQGIEKLPLKQIDYKGINISEFDVDIAIQRRPELILVDELAHTNAQPSKHKKRYQDVLELINNGINVYTTVNVQHLEGLNDIVGSVTSIKVGETIPDEIFDKADEVELIDIEAAELVERLKSGNIYKGGKIVAALENFFTEEHLNNLREVSMRRCADRIVKLSSNTEIKPKVLVLISPSPSSQKNIRIAAQMANNYHCKFSAMYVERSGELDEFSAKNLKEHIRLVSDLDGEVVIKYGESIVETIETYVKINGITNIIIGKTWQSIGKKVGFEERIISALPDIEVLIVPDKQSSTPISKIKVNLQKHEKIAIAIFAVIIMGISLIYIISKLTSFILLIASAIFVFVCLVVVKKDKHNLSMRFKQSNRVLDCINLLTANHDLKNSAEVSEYIAKVLSATFERSVLISFNDVVSIKNHINENTEFYNSTVENAILNWCKANEKPAGKGTDTLRNSNAIYFPIVIAPTVIACVAFSCQFSKFTITEKMFFSQIKSVVALLLKLQF